MNTRRTLTRRVDENDVNEDIPRQVEQVPRVALGDQGAQGYQSLFGGQGNEVSVVPLEMTNGDIREALLFIAQALTTHANLVIPPRVNVVERTMTSRLREFVRMNTAIFLGSKVAEDPQESLDEVYKIVHAMGGNSRGKAELGSYQLKDVAQVWYT